MPRPTAIYEITDSAKSQMPELIKNKTHSGLKEFVIALLYASIKLKTDTLNRQELNKALSTHIAPPKNPNHAGKPLSTSNSMISRRIKELESIGCIRLRQEYRTINAKKRKFTIHTLLSLTGLIEHIKQSADQSPAPQGRPKLNQLVVYSEMLTDNGLVKLEADNEITSYTEGAFSILESAARSRADKDNVIHCKYYIKKNDYLEITAATSTREGAGIMYSSDQRVIQALNGMLKQAHDEDQADLFSTEYPAKLIGEYYFFDIVKLTREIGLISNSKENRANVFKMIERLKDTTFSVDASQSQYWRERYMPDPTMNKAEYRYILEFYSAQDYCIQVGKSEAEEYILEDRFFVIKFHPIILNAMTKPRLAFISHDSLKKERLDIVHRLNNWVKPVVGVRPKANINENHHQYTIDIFHQRVRPAARLDNFERQFLHMAARQDKQEIRQSHDECIAFEYSNNGSLIPNGVFWLNGYYFKIEINEELAKEIYRKTRTVRKRRKKIYPVITIWRDRKDKIVGDDSDHNKALRRQMAELEAKEEVDENQSINKMYSPEDDIYPELEPLERIYAE